MQETLRTRGAKQRKPTVEEERERKGVAEGRGGGEGVAGGRGRKEGEEKGKRSPRGLKKKKKKKRRGGRQEEIYPGVPLRRVCSNVTVAEELTRQGSSRL